jgi:uncharacterized protein (UPF0332 family)
MSVLWNKAMEAAGDARALFARNSFNGAANRAYYAMYNAARAALEVVTDLAVVDVRRHSAVLKLFAQHLVNAGLLSPTLNKSINDAFETRAVADYDTRNVPREEAEELLALMDEMLEAVRPLVDKPRQP